MGGYATRDGRGIAPSELDGVKETIPLLNANARTRKRPGHFLCGASRGGTSSRSLKSASGGSLRQN